jgi:hypothetical protein
MGGANLNITSAEDNSTYSSSEDIEPVQNDTGHLSPIAKISPDRGLKIKVRNRVSLGSKVGVPIYMELRDQNGNFLPTGTDFALAVKPHGANQFFIVSDMQDNISYWNTNSLSTQQNDDNIDSVKVPLKYHEGSGKEDSDDRPESITIEGVDELLVLVDCPAQIDWNYSDFHIESEALSKGRA